MRDLNTTAATILLEVVVLFLSYVVEDFIQFTCPFKGSEFIESANNLIVYNDDRYRPPAKLLHYSPFQFGVMRDIDFLVVNFLLVEQSLRRATIGTVGGRVNLNLAQCKIPLPRLASKQYDAWFLTEFQVLLKVA